MAYLTIICVGQTILVGLLVFWGHRERQTLLQRIQAPEVAVAAHAIQQVPPSPPAVGWDDDDAHHEARGFVSREEMAEALK